MWTRLKHSLALHNTMPFSQGGQEVNPWSLYQGVMYPFVRFGSIYPPVSVGLPRMLDQNCAFRGLSPIGASSMNWS